MAYVVVFILGILTPFVFVDVIEKMNQVILECIIKQLLTFYSVNMV